MDDFIPHGARCEADDGRGSDFGQCSSRAIAYVTDDKGNARLVCEFHKKHHKPKERAGWTPHD